MKKHSISLLLSLWLVSNLSAQSLVPAFDSLALNNIPGYSLKSLSTKLSEFNPQEINGHSLSILMAFRGYSTGISRHPIADISLGITLELDDKMLFYSVSKVFYTPYQRNRYGKFVKANRKPQAQSYPSPATTSNAKAIQLAISNQLENIIAKITEQ